MSTKPTPEQRAEAKLHATAWEDAWGQLRKMEASSSPHVDYNQIKQLSYLAMAVASGYRKIANGNDLED
jgi:hypothetical protein